MKKILVLDLNFLGDILMSSPVYRLISEHNEKADTLGWDFCEPILKANPYIGKIHTTKAGTWNVIKALWKLRGKYDMVCQLNTSLKTNLLMLIVGARFRLGYSYKWKGFPLNWKVPIDHRTCTKGNRVDECLLLFESALDWEPTNRDMIYELRRAQ